MRLSIRKGFSFGLTSGIITTLGLIVGLHSSTHSKLVIIGGILVIAIADALSDALGIHISEEAENHHTTKEIWESTIATFLSKFVFALTFIVPILLFPLYTAIIVSIIWGLSLIAIFSFYMAKLQKIKPYHVVVEHLVIAVFVIIVTHYVGNLVGGLA
ncbi:VIT1/CCC1 transporter family protein [Nanoarchaeota archaeon]